MKNTIYKQYNIYCTVHFLYPYTSTIVVHILSTSVVVIFAAEILRRVDVIENSVTCMPLRATRRVSECEIAYCPVVFKSNKMRFSVGKLRHCEIKGNNNIVRGCLTQINGIVAGFKYLYGVIVLRKTYDLSRSEFANYDMFQTFFCLFITFDRVIGGKMVECYSLFYDLLIVYWFSHFLSVW